MGSYHKNRVMVSKRVGKNGYIEDIDFDDIEKIKNVFIEETKKIDIFDEDIKIIEELFNMDKLLYGDRYDKSVVLWDECYSEILHHSSQFYFEVIFKYTNFSNIFTNINNRLKKNYILEIICYEIGGSFVKQPNIQMIKDNHSKSMEKYLLMKNTLIDIVKDETISDDIIKKIVSINDVDMIKSSVRNKNISDETLDLILNQKVS